MNINEKAAYLKGLYDGMNMDGTTDEGKLFAALVDTVGEMAGAITELERQNDAINDELDLLEEALEELDEDLEELDEDLEEISGMLEGDYEKLYGYDDDDDDDDVDIDWEEEYYELKCPTCGEELVVEEELLTKGGMKCPACGEDLEFDLSELEDTCDCGHDHGHHHHHHGEGCTCGHDHGEEEEAKTEEK